MLNPISFMKAIRNPQKFLEEITKSNEKDYKNLQKTSVKKKELHQMK